MRTYSRELKEQLVKKLLLEGGPSVAALSRETGVGESTLFAWKKRFREQGSLASVALAPGPVGGAGNRDKLGAVIATATMNAVERSAYCREHGLHVEQVDAWRQAFEAADLRSGPTGRLELTRARQRVHALEKELCRKDRALAEVAALLALSKKAQALWGTDAEG